MSAAALAGFAEAAFPLVFAEFFAILAIFLAGILATLLTAYVSAIVLTYFVVCQGFFLNSPFRRRPDWRLFLAG